MNSLYICGFKYAWIFYMFHWSIWLVFFFFLVNIPPSFLGFPGSGMNTNNESAIMNQPAMQEMKGWTLLQVGKIPWEGNCNPLQYSCLGNYMDRADLWATVHQVTRVRHVLTDKLLTPHHTILINVDLSKSWSPCQFSKFVFFHCCEGYSGSFAFLYTL